MRDSRVISVVEVIMLCGLLGAYNAHGGLPEPGMIIAGQVFDPETDALVTAGSINVKYKQGGTTVVSVSDLLEEVRGPYATYSYALEIPMERAATGYPVSPNVLPVPTGAVTYDRVFTVTLPSKRAISWSDRVTISPETLRKASQTEPYPPAGDEFHSGDTDRDHAFSLGELLAEIELYTATGDHSYQCGWPFYVGTGAQECRGHSGDYKPANWQFSLGELLRMIELFSATRDHSYCSDSTTEDNFRPGPCPEKSAGIPAAAKSMPWEVQRPVVTRSIRIAAKGVLDVTVGYEECLAMPLTAFGIEEWVPEGWAYAGVLDGDLPLVGPGENASGHLEFVWFPAPKQFGYFSYRLHTSDEGALSWAGPEGEAVCRVLEVPGEMRVRILSDVQDSDDDGIADWMEGEGDADNDGTANYLDLDSDGDGIPDRVENALDMQNRLLPLDPHPVSGSPETSGGASGAADGGLIVLADSDTDGLPNFLDTDSDNDGLTDDVENAAGAAAKPPEEMPSDVDGDGIPNFVDTDSDNDGTGDGVERTFHSDPYNIESSVAVPSLGWWGYIVLFLVFSAALWVMRRRVA